MLIFTMFAVGLCTRVTSVLSLLVAISYVNRTPYALFGLDQINIMLTLYLAIGPSGQTFSVDRWLMSRRLGPAGPVPSVAANLAQRLIQVHMCVIYLFAGIAKLQGPSWWNGEAMWRAFANLEYQSVDMTWLAWHPWLINLMTHVSVIWEISFCVLVWRPLWRPLMLVGAVVLHVGIGLCLGMWTFALIMLVGCASFLPNEAVRQLALFLQPWRAVPANDPVYSASWSMRGSMRSGHADAGGIAVGRCQSSVRVRADYSDVTAARRRIQSYHSSSPSPRSAEIRMARMCGLTWRA